MIRHVALAVLFLHTFGVTTHIWGQVLYFAHGYTLAELAAAVGLHYASVSRIIKARRQDENARYKT